jgi:hypothetical protein
MKTPTPTLESAGLTQHFLPGGSNAISSWSVGPQSPGSEIPGAFFPGEVVLSFDGPWARDTATLHALEWLEQPDAATVPAGPMAGSGALLAERVFLQVEREVASLRRLKASSLGVVLRPDERTELFLQLSQDGPRLTARLRCEHGDVRALESHWAQLGESLSRRDVHLAPLQCQPNPRVDAGPDAIAPVPERDEPGKIRRASPRRRGPAGE